MSILSGIGGAVEKDSADVAGIRQWQISDSAEIAALVSSATKGGTTRIAGNLDWTGSYRAYGVIPAVYPGDSFVFHGSIDAVNGASGTVRCSQVEIVWDIEAALPISHTVSFEGNGELTLGAESAADATIADHLPSKGTKAELMSLIDTPAATEITDIRTITFTLTRQNPAYVSSSTAGFTQREEGNLDFTVAISVYEDKFQDLPALNSISGLRLYADDTLFWALDYVIVQEHTDLEVDAEGATLIGATINFGMVGHTDAGTTPVPTVGSIKTPESSPVTVWPV